MTLHVGGKTIELIYIDDKYNPGDVAVWLPDDRIMHAGFVGYIGRHPDIRPDYSHGTTAGMLKQLEALSALHPKIVVPAHGPVGDVTPCTLTDYLLLARQKVRTMMQQGLPLQTSNSNSTCTSTRTGIAAPIYPRRRRRSIASSMAKARKSRHMERTATSRSQDRRGRPLPHRYH